ncbi:MAG: TerY-C metal binding domain-containing protein [Candidatus Electrothrix sp. YB6]
MRRLPVFLVLDVSDSMVGEPLQFLEQGLNQLITTLRRDPHALETVFLSIIAFAGKVQTLVPLVDLPTFYPPKLPLGSGTALGKALTHLMQEIDTRIHPTTAERKGDWKPLVYLMTDGKPTDDCRDAVQTWKKKYAGRAQLVAIGLGNHAATGALSEFADHVLTYNGEDSADFSRFIDWMTMSVRSQSVRVQQQGEQHLPISLEKTGELLISAAEHPGSDEDFAIFPGRCQQRGTPYLLKYERVLLASVALSAQQAGTGSGAYCYRMTGCYPVDESYFDWSSVVNEIEAKVDFQQLLGQAGCPYCGNPSAMALCSCGRLFCVDGIATTAQCPWCRQQLTLVPVENNEQFDIVRSLG